MSNDNNNAFPTLADIGMSLPPLLPPVVTPSLVPTRFAGVLTAPRVMVGQPAVGVHLVRPVAIHPPKKRVFEQLSPTSVFKRDKKLVSEHKKAEEQRLKAKERSSEYRRNKKAALEKNQAAEGNGFLLLLAASEKIESTACGATCDDVFVCKNCGKCTRGVDACGVCGL